VRAQDHSQVGQEWRCQMGENVQALN
jgi:hypothetical protein